MNKKVGNFEGEIIISPFPFFCIIKYGDVEINFSHREISDIEYLIKRMKKHLKINLKEDRDEV